MDNNFFMIYLLNFYFINFLVILKQKYSSQISDKINRVVNNNEFIQQAIKLRLNSDIGNIRGNETMGADLFKFMHVNTQKSRLLTQISDQVKTAISDILPNCTVSAYIINSNYLNYHDSIKIVIVNNEDIYYYYI